MRLLITGSRGFVGGSVGRVATAAGHDVLGLARASQPDPNWPGHYAPADVAYADLAGTIRDFAPDAVVHCAGTASVGASLAAPMDDLRAAVLTWANLLDGVRRSGLKPLVIFPSSAAIYGNPQRLPVSEDAPAAPISPYGFHKAACELLAHEYATCFGLDVTVARVFSIYGPTQRRLLVWELTEQFLRQEPVVWLQGTGDESRDYLYVDDLAAAIVQLAAQRGRISGFERFNVASGKQVTTLELAERIRSLIAPETEIRCRGLLRPGDPRHWQADVTRLRALLPSWQYRSLIAGLADCLGFWRSNVRPVEAALERIGPISIPPGVTDRLPAAARKTPVA
jgi:UDP-glucose 4-epimerase